MATAPMGNHVGRIRGWARVSQDKLGYHPTGTSQNRCGPAGWQVSWQVLEQGASYVRLNCSTPWQVQDPELGVELW